MCDDEELIRWSLATHLEQEGYTVLTASDGQECLELVGRQGGIGLVLMDLKMPRKDGLTTLRELRAAGHEVPVLVLTAHGGVESAIEATRLGAAGYLSKPFDVREISLAVEKALAHDRLKHEVHYLRRRERAGYGDFIGGHPCLKPLFDTLRRLETVDAPTVLILGESGTGKDVIARSIHSRGPRKDQPFVAVDCASLPEQLIESELFGHERGSFTDAKAQKPGLFEIAQRGMVFLDEIGELPLATQSKLLRAIEDRSFRRVGGVRQYALDAGIVAATNRNLKECVEKGTFREDLYFRLDVISVRVPPLRDRASDVPLLVEHFLERFTRNFGKGRIGMDGEAMALLQQHRWPGNVRELRNLVERLVLLGPDDVIRAEHLPPEIRFARPPSSASTGGCPFELPEEGVDLEAVERGLLEQALARTSGNQSAAARLLGISRYALRYRMEKFHISA
ncbi:MAG: sigma-54-dependent Fis family transcriptional regulator [Alphaproteobacteria bacterium]|nr:sigma-54-dependent Fis family transcriptional regulator [Alphaproteobacteria bacterium]